jgi:5-formyltetrahydrofolate cyclo-ligase
MRRRLRALPPGQREQEGMEAAARMEMLPLWRRFGTVLLFLSMKDEIDTLPLLNAAWKAGKQVFVPRIQGADMRFYRVKGGPWVTGPFGIPEPPEDPDGLLRQADFPALVVTPGLAFDAGGRRLGRGKGYYDRFLAGLNRADYYAVGLCLDCQRVPCLPAGDRDKPVDALCTGRTFTAINPSDYIS